MFIGTDGGDERICMCILNKDSFYNMSLPCNCTAVCFFFFVLSCLVLENARPSTKELN